MLTVKGCCTRYFGSKMAPRVREGVKFHPFQPLWLCHCTVIHPFILELKNDEINSLQSVFPFAHSLSYLLQLINSPIMLPVQSGISMYFVIFLMLAFSSSLLIPSSSLLSSSHPLLSLQCVRLSLLVKWAQYRCFHIQLHA